MRHQILIAAALVALLLPSAAEAAPVTLYQAPGLSKSRNLADVPNPSAARTALGVAIGTDVQAYDADLTTWAGITPAAGIGTFLATPSSANLAAALTDETGAGRVVYNTDPGLSGGVSVGGAVAAVAVGAGGSGSNKAAFTANGGSGAISLSNYGYIFAGQLNSVDQFYLSPTGFILGSTATDVGLQATSGKALCFWGGGRTTANCDMQISAAGNGSFAGSLTVTGNTNMRTVTVSALGSAATAGARATVSDASACTFGSTPSGGGSTVCPVVANGSAWVAG